MPGIAGIIAPLDEGPLPQVLSAMIRGMRASESTETQTWNSSAAGLAATGRDARKRLVERSGVCLALIGSVVPDRLLAGRFGMETGRNINGHTADCLLDLYIQHGPCALEGLNGKYVTAIWDEPQKRLSIISGRGGLEPLYYWHSGGRLIFASRLAGVAAHPDFPRQVNPPAVMDLLATGQMLDERTLYAEAKALPPAATVTFEHGQLSINSYWQPVLYAPGDPVPDEDEAMETQAAQMREAVINQLNTLNNACLEVQPPVGSNSIPPGLHSNPYALLLTGGLDSRLLAGVISRFESPGIVHAVTIGHSRARDVRYGGQIAAAAGMEYTVIPSNPRFLVDYAAECVRRTDGSMNVHAAWILGASRFLAENSLPAVMSGVGAETVSGRHWLAEQRAVDSRAEALRCLSEAHWDFPRAASLLRAGIRDDVAEASRSTLRQTLAAAPSDHLLGWADYLSFRQFRRHPTGNILSEDALVLEPFYDISLLEYAYRLPEDMRMGGKLYKKMIIRYFPEMAAIGYTDSGMLLSDELKGRIRGRNYKDELLRFYYRAARRTARQIPFLHFPVLSDNPAHAIYQNTWLRDASRSFTMSLIEKKDLYADVLDVQLVRQLVDDHMAGRTDSYRMIGAVLTFILWRELSGA